jgi:hypothetical protein
VELVKQLMNQRCGQRSLEIESCGLLATWGFSVTYTGPKHIFGHVQLLVQNMPEHGRTVGRSVDGTGYPGTQNATIGQVHFVCLMMAYWLTAGVKNKCPSFYGTEPLVVVAGRSSVTHAAEL